MSYPSIEDILPILKAAGKVILEVYESESFEVELKGDDSPVTKADKLANELIVDYLRQNFDFPIVSEEAEHQSYEERKAFDVFWLVDPLDGTKEFINKNGQFTVNIALIQNRIPVFGAIYVPVTDVFYFGTKDGAYKKVGNGELQSIKANEDIENITAVVSRSHPQSSEKEFYDNLQVAELLSVGSSLKFCMIAEGKADVYFRTGPTMEWDTAAGQAILKSAGGEMYQDKECKEVFKYNKEKLLNGSFLCVSNRKFEHLIKKSFEY